jgi:2-polyprenyl-3-methyl-5-hydroxy-6-metoxy-1,4-benzoquinol methylase
MKTMDQTRQLYTARAGLYERFFVGFLGWERELGRFFRRSDYLRSHMKILDAGCGSGIITRTLYTIAEEERQRLSSWWTNSILVLEARQ